jgi:hypothetical protein
MCLKQWRQHVRRLIAHGITLLCKSLPQKQEEDTLVAAVVYLATRTDVQFGLRDNYDPVDHIAAISTKEVITNFMELSPSWDAASAATQELSNILWNPKVHYRVHKSPPLVPILNQIDPVHTNQSYLPKSNFNIIPRIRLGLPSGLFPFGFPTNILYAFLFSPFVLHALPISF